MNSYDKKNDLVNNLSIFSIPYHSYSLEVGTVMNFFIKLKII